MRLDLAKEKLGEADTEEPGEDTKAGFVKENGEWVFYENGEKKTGWHKADYGTWYYFEDFGGMATGWKKVDGNWYYFFGSGAMASNRALNLGGRVYRFAPSGRML